MGSLRRSLLVLCVAVTITITSTLSVQQKKKLSDQEARSLLQATYNNQVSDDNFLYKILEIKHVSYETERQIVRFTIQETRCLKSENQNPDQCEFKDDGLVKDCSGRISSARFHQLVVFSCNTVAGQGQAQEEVDADASIVPLRGHPGRRRERRDIEEEPLASGRGESGPYLSQDGFFFQPRTYFSFKPKSFPHAKPAGLLPARRLPRSNLPPPPLGRPGFPRPRPHPRPRPRPQSWPGR
ncbi:uncharacterized protein LOC141551441 isoform X2 [Sminthopsis crassicaudata]|uniref:uncharacterized protein LOC141551441 isoform X2 n=1 Tax=Sminthopsis crassicaudata TaxID=9301 RepID=UPI003D69619E